MEALNAFSPDLGGAPKSETHPKFVTVRGFSWWREQDTTIKPVLCWSPAGTPRTKVKARYRIASKSHPIAKTS